MRDSRPFPSRRARGPHSSSRSPRRRCPLARSHGRRAPVSVSRAGSSCKRLLATEQVSVPFQYGSGASQVACSARRSLKHASKHFAHRSMSSPAYRRQHNCSATAVCVMHQCAPSCNRASVRLCAFAQPRLVRMCASRSLRHGLASVAGLLRCEVRVGKTCQQPMTPSCSSA